MPAYDRYIKVTKAGKYEYVNIVRSFRENGKVKHEVLFNLGRRDEIENNPAFQRMAQRLAELSGLKDIRKDMDECSEAIIRNWGYVVYKRIWKDLDMCV
ncbi:MAG: hypothetical protein HPY66_2131 [Firmicutes bacterium]|nr:hypothetical protein [Bacillota bacterium]